MTYISRLCPRKMLLLHHDYRIMITAASSINPDKLNPGQIEDAQTKVRDSRRKTKAIPGIEARTKEDHQSPSVAMSVGRSEAAPGSISSATAALAARRPIVAERVEPSPGPVHGRAPTETKTL